VEATQPGTLILHAGGFGDLVLAASLVALLREQHPGAPITLACRSEFAAIALLYPDRPDHIVHVGINPYAWAVPSDELVAQTQPLLEQLEPGRFARFFSAELRATWLGPVIAAHVMAAESVISNLPASESALVSSMLRRLGLRAVRLRHVRSDSTVHELSRYRQLAGRDGDPVPLPWQIAPEIAALAAARLANLGLEPGNFIACFPFGSPSTLVKRWAGENFARVLQGAQEKWGLATLLLGAAAERSYLDAFADELAAAGVTAAVFAGEPYEFSVVGALLGASRAYLGNDTGLAHLAQIHQVPGVTIFGGGAWPFYAPWGSHSVGVVAPLPCFQCYWDCAFGRGVCVERIDVEAVERALHDVVEMPAIATRTDALERVTPEEATLIALASNTYRQAQEDRGARLRAIWRLREIIERGLARAARRSKNQLRGNDMRSGIDGNA